MPEEARLALKAGLSRVYPELASKPWKMSRICWYSDRPSGDWLIDYHEKYPSLFVAAGCCGHAFSEFGRSGGEVSSLTTFTEYMPLLGDLILDGIEGRWPEEQRNIWAFRHRVPGRRDESRGISVLKVLPEAPIQSRL